MGKKLHLMKYRCYNSGPISSLGFITALNNFKAADEAIEDLGMEPVNPMEVTWGLRPKDAWFLHMAKDILLLMSCRAVYFQQGWESSRGANIEFRIARALGKEIYIQK